MRIYFIIFFFFSLSFYAHSQTSVDTIVYIEKDSINPIDVLPEFPGGEKAFLRFIQTHLIYPSDAVKQRIQGSVYVEYIVEKDGLLSNIKAVEGKSLTPSCDQVVIDILLKSPRWKPGLKNEQPVRVKKVTKVKFVLSN